MKKLLCLMGGAMLLLNGYGQKIKPLIVGDMMPDVEYSPVINYKTPSLRVTNFGSKLVILDFWATWCTSCLHAFPASFQLQKEFKDSLQIVLVNSRSSKDSYDKIEKFLAARKSAYSFPSIAMDTILRAMFPHAGIPHYVWILNNKVRAITSYGSVTRENIRQILSGGSLAISRDTELKYYRLKPLFENGNGGQPPKFIFKSFLAPYVLGLPSLLGISQADDGLLTRITQVNSRLLYIYTYAYPVMRGIPKARIIFNIKDSSHFFSNEQKDILFNYQANFPPKTQKEAEKIMQGDLDRYFGYHVTPAEKNMECWVLKSLDSNKATQFSKDIKRATNLFEHSGLPIYFNNYKLSYLRKELEERYNQPFLDETGISQPVTLSLPGDLHDVKALKSSLLKQGLSLTREIRKIHVIILSDK